MASYAQAIVRDRGAGNEARAEFRAGLASLATPFSRLAAERALDRDRYDEVHALFTQAARSVGP